MNKKDLISSTINELIKLSQRMNRLEKKPIDFGTGEFLYQSEIHTIEAVGKHPGCTSSDLCRRFGVTKGAISQIIKKLTDKGYVTKETNIDYAKEKLLRLTEKGLKAYKGHERLHELMDSDFLKKFDTVPVEHVNWFRNALVEISSHLDKYLDM